MPASWGSRSPPERGLPRFLSRFLMKTLDFAAFPRVSPRFPALAGLAWAGVGWRWLGCGLAAGAFRGVHLAVLAHGFFQRSPLCPKAQQSGAQSGAPNRSEHVLGARAPSMCSEHVLRARARSTCSGALEGTEKEKCAKRSELAASWGHLWSESQGYGGLAGLAKGLRKTRFLRPMLPFGGTLELPESQPKYCDFV